VAKIRSEAERLLAEARDMRRRLAEQQAELTTKRFELITFCRQATIATCINL
jgi:hypothetical protein